MPNRIWLSFGVRYLALPKQKLAALQAGIPSQLPNSMRFSGLFGPPACLLEVILSRTKTYPGKIL